ncbi:DUF761 domain-containing protein/DUF4408 domain-containing protein [Quillaja saponaria]|uniref:DUF761 domain-containing protein/DUF4408 domain-containing protein n=1 Tax=Quillaja saponaria TaxID=32244 RepID=A0AAD7LD93_QUISA|nr:DUF761 domain-containing protein/DUF4408 domain-containing protein [Quillaja saponaria]
MRNQRSSIEMAEPYSVTSLFAFMVSWCRPTSLFLVLNLVIGTIFIISRFSTQKKPRHQSQFGSDNSPQVVRAPSLLDRVKSVNFPLYKFQPTNPETQHFLPPEPEQVNSYPYPNPNQDTPPQINKNPSLLNRLKSSNFLSLCRSDSINAEQESLPPTEAETDSKDPNPDSDSSQVRVNLLQRSKSEMGTAALRRSPEKIKKSTSEKSAWGYGEEEEEEEEEDDDDEAVERRRPATTRAERISVKKKETELFMEEEGVDAKADDFINRFKKQLRLQRLDSVLRFKDTPNRGN